MIYLELFWEFFKIGLFSIGGGMATVPFLTKLVETKGWYTHAELIDMIAVSEAMPGPMGIDMASYVGYRIGFDNFGVFGGILGTICAVVGEIAPSIITVVIIAIFLDRFRKSFLVDSAFFGLRPASAALICFAVWTITRVSLVDPIIVGGLSATGITHSILLLSAAALIGAVLWARPKLSPPLLIGASALFGIVLGL